MRYDRTVIAYHGCEALVAEAILAGDPFRLSNNDYDWLGRGIYLWEYGPARAQSFAQSKYSTNPACVGALIQLANCFDLMDVRHTKELSIGFEKLAASGVPMPRNGGKGGKARRLDCAVINYTLQAFEKEGQVYDSVRAPFMEGVPVFPESGILAESHIQICVRNPACIIGVFRPTF